MVIREVIRQEDEFALYEVTNLQKILKDWRKSDFLGKKLSTLAAIRVVMTVIESVEQLN